MSFSGFTWTAYLFLNFMRTNEKEALLIVSCLTRGNPAEFLFYVKPFFFNLKGRKIKREA